MHYSLLNNQRDFTPNASKRNLQKEEPSVLAKSRSTTPNYNFAANDSATQSSGKFGVKPPTLGPNQSYGTRFNFPQSPKLINNYIKE